MRRGRRHAGAALALCALAAGRAAEPPPAPPPPLSAYSAFGSSLAQSGHFAELGWTEAQFNAFLDGIRSTYHGQPVPMDEAARQLAAAVGRRIQELAAAPPAPAAAVPAPDPKAVAEYFRTVSKRFGLQWSATGLGYNVGQGPSGVRPRPGDVVTFSCQALAADGTTPLPVLSSDRVRAKMAGMLPGLFEGLQMMTVGSQGVFVVPAKLSFGSGAWPDGVAPGSPLIFRIALQGVEPAPAAP